jgi:nitrite reductase (NADH) small subunit/3-phenylpropionate/trans-cinnamate dioxygenase ferredoxin subunit
VTLVRSPRSAAGGDVVQAETEFVTVCRAEELAPNASRVIRAGDLTIAVFNVTGEFFAIDDRCPHKGASLGRGLLVDCPAHNFKIDVTTGRNPKVPVLKVACYRVTVEEGLVKVLVPLAGIGAGRG